MEYGRLPTTWEYYMEHCEKGIDLRRERSRPCVFHNEEHGTSFSYRSENDTCACFGRCHFSSAGPIQLHKIRYKFKDDEEAEKSLRAMYRVAKSTGMELKEKEVYVDSNSLEYDMLLQKCIMVATTVEQWLDLDYVMSKFPNDKLDFRELLEKWGVSYD